ncbi:hypothetical protein STANM309S_03542 [Streptomyces tanashiensis]
MSLFVNATEDLVAGSLTRDPNQILDGALVIGVEGTLQALFLWLLLTNTDRDPAAAAPSSAPRPPPPPPPARWAEIAMSCGDGPWHGPFMPNDIGYPVFRSPDLVLALSMAPPHGARQLRVHQRLPLRRAPLRRRGAAGAKELPEGWFRGQDHYGEFGDRVPFEDRPGSARRRPGGLPDDRMARSDGRLPVDHELLNQAVDSVEDAFTAAIGPRVGEINGQDLCWPDAPDVGFRGEYSTQRRRSFPIRASAVTG